MCVRLQTYILMFLNISVYFYEVIDVCYVHLNYQNITSAIVTYQEQDDFFSRLVFICWSGEFSEFLFFNAICKILLANAF